MKKLAAVLVTASVLLGSAVAVARTPSILKLILSVLTPNMNMNLPNPSSTLGPAWASQLNAALQVVDAHNHTPGNGVKVPTGGININADLPVNGFVLADAGAVQFVDQGSTLPSTKKGLVYDSGGNLWFNDGAGNAIQLTGSGGVIGGNVCGSPGGCTIITPASFKTAGGTQVCSIDNSGNLSCSGSGTFATGLTVSAGGATIAGPVNLNAALTNTSSANVNTLTVGGAAQLDGGVNCTFNVTNAGSVVFSADCAGALTALSGATFGGQVNMGGNRITNLGSAVLGNDAVTLGQLLDGGGAFVGSQNSCVFYVLFPDAGGAGLMLYADCSGNVGVPNGLWVDGGTVLGHGLESVGVAQFDANTTTKGSATVTGEIFANNQPDSLQGVNLKIPDGVTANVWGRLTNGPISDHTLRIMENGFFDAGSANKWCEDDNTDPLLVENVSAASGTWSWNHLPAGACSSSVTQDAKLGTDGTLTLANQLLADGGVVVNGELDTASLVVGNNVNFGQVTVDGGEFIRLGNLSFQGNTNQGITWDGGGVNQSILLNAGKIIVAAGGVELFSTATDQILAQGGTITLSDANSDSLIMSGGASTFNTPLTASPAITASQLATLGQVNAAVVGSFAGSIYVPGNLTVDGGIVGQHGEYLIGTLGVDGGAVFHGPIIANGNPALEGANILIPDAVTPGIFGRNGASPFTGVPNVYEQTENYYFDGGAGNLTCADNPAYVGLDFAEVGQSQPGQDAGFYWAILPPGPCLVSTNVIMRLLPTSPTAANLDVTGTVTAAPAVTGTNLATLNQVNAAVAGSFTGSVYVPGQLVVDGGERLANNEVLIGTSPSISDVFGDSLSLSSNLIGISDAVGDFVRASGSSAVMGDSAGDTATLHAGLFTINTPIVASAAVTGVEAAQLEQIETVIPGGLFTGGTFATGYGQPWRPSQAAHSAFIDYIVTAAGSGTAATAYALNIESLESLPSVACTVVLVMSTGSCAISTFPTAAAVHAACSGALSTSKSYVVQYVPGTGCGTAPSVLASWTATYP